MNPAMRWEDFRSKVITVGGILGDLRLPREDCLDVWLPDAALDVVPRS